MTESENLNIESLSRRIEFIDRDVKNLREEFDEFRKTSVRADKALAGAIGAIDSKLDRHVVQNDVQYHEHDRKITGIRAAIDTLSEELKEPMEVYRTAKYGAKATTLLVAFVKWAVPVCVGLLIGYNALQAKMLAEVRGAEPATKQRAESE